jgi:hypothetical protein
MSVIDFKSYKTAEREGEREMKTKTKKCSTENTTRDLFAQELHTQPVYYVLPRSNQPFAFQIVL